MVQTKRYLELKDHLAFLRAALKSETKEARAFSLMKRIKLAKTRLKIMEKQEADRRSTIAAKEALYKQRMIQEVADYEAKMQERREEEARYKVRMQNEIIAIDKRERKKNASAKK